MPSIHPSLRRNFRLRLAKLPRSAPLMRNFGGGVIVREQTEACPTAMQRLWAAFLSKATNRHTIFFGVASYSEWETALVYGNRHWTVNLMRYVRFDGSLGIEPQWIAKLNRAEPSQGTIESAYLTIVLGKDFIDRTVTAREFPLGLAGHSYNAKLHTPCRRPAEIPAGMRHFELLMNKADSLSPDSRLSSHPRSPVQFQ